MYVFEKVEQEATAMTMTGATMTVKLDENSDYTMLLLRFAFTADSSQVDATIERVLDWITSITIIGDDDKYIKNATARQLAAEHFYRTKHPVSELVDAQDNVVNILELPVYFGRFFSDKEYFLKGGQFSKLELNVANTDSATGNFFDAGTLEVRSYQFKDHALSPKGVIRTKEVKDWTPPSATASYTEELPDKHLIEKLLVVVVPTATARTAALGAEYSTVVDKLKLTYKGGDIVVFNDDIEELAWRNCHIYGYVDTYGVLDGQEDDFWDTGLGYLVNAQLVCAEDPTAAGLQASCVKATTQKLQLKQQGVAADNVYYIHAIGYAYLDSVIFDFAPEGNMENLYDPAMYKKAELKITAGSTAGKVKIVVCEIVTSF